MRLNLVGPFVVNSPFGTEIAFKKGLELIGHEVNAVDPNLPDQIFWDNVDATIVFKTAKEYNAMIPHLGGIKIVYQPDDFRFPHIRQMMHEMRDYCDFALSFDDTSAAAIVESGYQHARSLLVTADPDLYKKMPSVTKDLDFVFVGSLSGDSCHASRLKMLKILQAAGFKVAYVYGLYDIPKIVELYNRAKVVLNHATDVGQQFGTGYGYQCRHFETGFSGACLLTNTELGERKIQSIVRFSDEQMLIERAKELLDSCELRESYADNLYQEMNDFHRPEHRAAEITAFIEECRLR